MGVNVTIIIAQKRADNIIITSDTMIGNISAIGQNIIPGRLKVLCIGNKITVAFAGNADHANIAIKKCRMLAIKENLEEVIEIIKVESSRCETDYILAFHNPQATLLCIRRGGILEETGVCYLGNAEKFRGLIEEARNEDNNVPLRDGRLFNQFSDRLVTNNDLSEGVGGLPITVFATKEEHKYLRLGCFYTYKFPILIPGNTTYQPIEQAYTGDGHFQFYIMPSKQSDTPVVGACILQACMGYIYSPIQSVEAIPIRLAPPGSEWHGNSQNLFDVFRLAIERHAAQIAPPLKSIDL